MIASRAMHEAPGLAAALARQWRLKKLIHAAHVLHM
jgi:hypothetical protein